jgi:hypothetical protein
MPCNSECKVKILKTEGSDPDNRELQRKNEQGNWISLGKSKVPITSDMDGHEKYDEAEKKVKDHFKEVFDAGNGTVALGDACPDGCDCIVTRADPPKTRDWAPKWFEFTVNDLSGAHDYRVTWKLKRTVTISYGACDEKGEKISLEPRGRRRRATA